MTIIDTNVILRYILNDIPEQADTAAAIIDEGARTSPEIIAEVVYVLTKLYAVPRNRISDIITPLFDEVSINEENIIRRALDVYSELKFDFVDCILIARKELTRENIFTFDKKLAKKLDNITNVK